MSVTKRKNSPFYQYDFTISGRRHRGTLETTSRKEAEQLYAKIRSNLYAELKLGKKQDILLRSVFNKYYIEHASSQAWAVTVDGFLKKMAGIWGLDLYLSEIGNKELAQLVEALRKDSKKPATINRHIAVFRKLHGLAKNVWGYQVSDINFGLHKQKEPDCRIRYLTTAEAELLVNHAAPHLKPIIQFALYTGARLGNILNLKWKDVDLVNKRLIFKVKSTRPGGKNHIVDMATPCFEMLSSMKPSATSEYVFTYNGRKILKVKTGFNNACKRAGISNFRFHDLRHTCASWLVQAGEPIEVVKEILGHEDIATTLKYAHHNNSRAKDALENVFKSHQRHTGDTL